MFDTVSDLFYLAAIIYVWEGLKWFLRYYIRLHAPAVPFPVGSGPCKAAEPEEE